MATLFHPRTTSFGELVLRPRPRVRPDWARWSTAAEAEEASRSRNNLFIAIGFVTAFLTFLSGLYVVDSAIYPQGYQHVASAPTAAVDYD